MKNYHSITAKDFLDQINNSSEKPFGMSQWGNPTMWTNEKLGAKIIGDIKISFPPTSDDQLEKIKDEMINSTELPPAHFAKLDHLQKQTKDPDLLRVFKLVPL